MNNCNGAPAEVSALAYVEGLLPEDEAERFEEHYFECPACLDYLQTIQGLESGMKKAPAVEAAPPRRNLLAWPTRMWVLGAAAAALLVAGIFVYRGTSGGASEPNEAKNTAPVAEPAAKIAEPAKATLLADLTMPAFAAPSLRGGDGDANFAAGMKAYLAGDCAGALQQLKKAADSSRNGRAAKFYAGACEMKRGDWAAATASLRAVAGAGDSPQQEAALYSLAQIALEQNDAQGARGLLKQTIALHGDMEQKARAEERKLAELLEQEHK